MINLPFLKNKVSKHPLFENKNENEIDNVAKLITLYILRLKYKDLHVLYSVLYNTVPEEIDYFITKIIPYNYVPFTNNDVHINNEFILNKIIENIITTINYDINENNINDTIEGFLSIVSNHIKEICDNKKCNDILKKNVIYKMNWYIKGTLLNDMIIMEDIYKNIPIDYIGGIMLIVNNLKLVKYNINNSVYSDFANERLFKFISICIENEKLLIKEGKNVRNEELNSNNLTVMKNESEYMQYKDINNENSNDTNESQIVNNTINKKTLNNVKKTNNNFPSKSQNQDKCKYTKFEKDDFANRTQSSSKHSSVSNSPLYMSNQSLIVNELPTLNQTYLLNDNIETKQSISVKDHNLTKDQIKNIGTIKQKDVHYNQSESITNSGSKNCEFNDEDLYQDDELD